MEGRAFGRGSVAMLRTISQHANRKLRDIAQRLVEEKVLSSNHSS